jgi:hypothetical protein
MCKTVDAQRAYMIVYGVTNHRYEARNAAIRKVQGKSDEKAAAS